MANERVVQRISVAKEENLTDLNLSGNQLTEVPQEIGELKNLTMLDLSENTLSLLPQEIGELKSLTTLDLSRNHLIQLPPEIEEFKYLTILDLYNNHLIQLPPEIREFKNLTALTLFNNKLTQVPPEIGELKNLETLYLYCNQLTQLPPEIGELKNLSILALNNNKLTQLPPEIGELKNLKILNLSHNCLTKLPPEIKKLKNLTTLYLSYNQLTKIPLEIGELKNLTTLYLDNNELTILPSEIGKLKNLTILELDKNQLTILPPKISELKNLITLNLSNNPLTSPPPEIISMGIEAIYTYLKQSKTTENNEAKLILVGNGGVGKTCLAHRLVTNGILEDSSITEGINISKWSVPAPDSRYRDIKLNIWDFGGQEIYHATHQFFLTERSVYLLLWNARRTKDYDNIYYWLHTIEAFGGDSPIILVMSKMNESDDDLNLSDLRYQFPQIAGYLKVDSKDNDGKRISILKETISETAWSLSLMRTAWVDSWYKVRKKLEELKENWITYDEFRRICISEGLDDRNISILDEYLHELGVTLHFKDRLENMVILKPEWATDAFYSILSTKSVLHREGVLLYSELSQIWGRNVYITSIYPQLMDLMNKFELSYELPDKRSYLVPELLPKSAPKEFKWDEKDNLSFYYCYDSFLPPGIIPRFIVRMHQKIEKKENGLPLCWREGVVMKLQDSRAFVMMRPDKREIVIRIIGDNIRGALGAICDQFDQINDSIKKIKVTKEIPCNCSKNCSQRYPYEKLLRAKTNNIETILCYESFEHVSVSSLLEGYIRRDKRLSVSHEISNQLVQNFLINSNNITSSESKQMTKVEQTMDVATNITVNLKIDLPQIQTDFDNLRREIKNSNSELKSEMDEIQNSLDEVSANNEKESLKKPFNKLRRFLDKLSDPNSDYSKLVTGTQKGIEYAQKLGRTYNKFAQWLAMPQVPDLFLGI